MDSINAQRLKFRRQYLFLPKQVSCPFLHEVNKVGEKYYLYCHIDLKLEKIKDGNRELYLLGDIYSYENPTNTNEIILKGLFSLEFDEILEETSNMSGRYVLISVIDSKVNIFSDTCGSRKVYYTINENKISCSSNQHLLASIEGYQPTSNQDLIKFYKSSEFVNDLAKSNIATSTYYDEIEQLIPNHFLNFSDKKATRFWPNVPLPDITDEECVVKSVEMIKGFFSAVANRHSLMVPVTSGYDSRVIMAATRELREKVYYYINYTPSLENSSDIKVPQKILKDQNLDFHILRADQEIDSQFIKIFYENNPLANEQYLPLIYNYLQNFSEKINLPGELIPIVKSHYVANRSKLNGTILARLNGLTKYPVAYDLYEEWLKDVRYSCEKYNYNVLEFFYWEERVANWGTQILLDKEIGQDDYILFGCRKLVSTMLAFDEKRRKKPNYELHRELIHSMWPELLKYPFNPSFKNSFKNVLSKIGLYDSVIRLKKNILG